MRQEIGGLMVTLLALAESYHYEATGWFDEELRRIESLPADKFILRQLVNHAAGIGDLPEVNSPQAEKMIGNEELLAMWRKINTECSFCGSTEDLTVDHIIPVSRGGTNDLENLQPLCRSCNSYKKDRLISARVVEG